jgi:hypothetical protein
MAWIKKAYLYLVSLVTLVIMIIAAIGLINMGFKAVLGVSNYDYYGPAPYCEKVVAENSGAPRECTAEEKADQEARDRKNQSDNQKRDIAQYLAMLIVAAPVFYFHWMLARKEQ